MKNISELTDQELLQEAKNLKTAAIINAIFIGFLFGIIIYSVLKNTFGLFSLIPLFIVFKLINSSKYKSGEIQNALKERNLK